jgi:hypothetical protein
LGIGECRVAKMKKSCSVLMTSPSHHEKRNRTGFNDNASLAVCNEKQKISKRICILTSRGCLGLTTAEPKSHDGCWTFV